ncbi:MAG: PD-(D/E)XK nuclease family protein [Castellaniella sp.]
MQPFPAPMLDFEHFARLPAEETLVLSVNNRHARRVLARLFSRLDAGSPVMAIPRIVPFTAWLGELAASYSFSTDCRLAGHAVDHFGSQLLWREVIESIEANRMLLDTVQAARFAADADRLMDDWEIVVREDEITPDHERFLLWREAYSVRLAALDLDDDNRTLAKVCRAMDEGRLAPSMHTLVLAGFSELAPRAHRLLEAMRRQGVEVCQLQDTHVAAPPENLVCVQARDAVTEWRLAVQWAQARLQADPQGRFAILAPDLEADLPFVHRVLDRELGAQGLAFNVGLAPALADWPLVRAALNWLRILAQSRRGTPMPAAEAGAALMAGACAGDLTEASERAMLDARWRHDGAVELTPAQFASALEQGLPLLARAWEGAFEWVSRLERDTLDRHVSHIRHALQLLGFPGERAVDSAAYQSLQAFDSMLDRLATQAVLADNTDFSSACRLMTQLARQTRFQPQRDPDARLDVLGLLEAEGGQWDGIWILGLTDEALPAAPSPNPLLPSSALRRAGAPRSTPERELLWAQQIFQTLRGAAPEIRVSHAAFEGDRNLRPSPLLAGFAVEAHSPPAEQGGGREMAWVSDDAGPALVPGERVRGGIAVLDTQARNPLWAFARYRLGARALPDYARQTDQNMRGLFLHRVMELFWQALPDQTALHTLREQGGMGVQLRSAIQQAAGEWLTSLDPVLRALEEERAEDVVSRWLSIELARPPFRIVALEQRESWSQAGLSLDLRIDRIDRMEEDGRLVIIDYKTGGSTPQPYGSWARERPIELQLPVYASRASQSTDDIAALALVRLHARQVDTHGLAQTDVGLDGLSRPEDSRPFAGMSWMAVLQHWRTAIGKLAAEFAGGHAANQIQDLADLRYCDVLPFLRLSQASNEDEDDSNDNATTL